MLVSHTTDEGGLRESKGGESAAALVAEMVHTDTVAQRQYILSILEVRISNTMIISMCIGLVYVF